jgi:hypothetical protein
MHGLPKGPAGPSETKNFRVYSQIVLDEAGSMVACLNFPDYKENTVFHHLLQGQADISEKAHSGRLEVLEEHCVVDVAVHVAFVKADPCLVAVHPWLSSVGFFQIPQKIQGVYPFRRRRANPRPAAFSFHRVLDSQRAKGYLTGLLAV